MDEIQLPAVIPYVQRHKPASRSLRGFSFDALDRRIHLRCGKRVRSREDSFRRRLESVDYRLLSTKVGRGFDPAVVLPFERLLATHLHTNVVVHEVDLVDDVHHRSRGAAEMFFKGILGYGLQVFEKVSAGASQGASWNRRCIHSHESYPTRERAGPPPRPLVIKGGSR